ncbi:unnamed protein product [marine sediment metagenome]|uniref:(S)-ureidoglycine aminohydrolase cupin domain-containing protein n=1 Tax=marine sediment metagenome TaxID=412755 RepID=X1HVI2_9ZZZZ
MYLACFVGGFLCGGVQTVSILYVDCEYFKVDKGTQGKGYEMLLAPGEIKTLIILAGSGTILGADGIGVEFKAGDCLVIPAAYEGAMQFADDTQYLTVTI